MHHELEGVVLRKPEPHDVEALYAWKNDATVASMLVGFTTGYTRADLTKWVDLHRSAADEAFFMIVRRSDDLPIGHVALYQINHRLGTGDFAILLGDQTTWGKGLGRSCTRFMCDYGFTQLNLRRITLGVLSTNVRAHKLYQSLGFVEEGRLRQAQFKNGAFVDVILMALFRDEFKP
ncbi:MAG: GNAT family N-acetyltransferase [Myxococcales bacterium]|nr:GNAT family N-acetyltransferase [Myxococcales bacterium]